MIESRAKYLQTILLLDEINYFHSNLSFENPTLFFRLLKHNILALYILKDLITINSKILKENVEFNNLKKSIHRELEFINHIRNKISGHFDSILMLKSAQWQPQIFFEDNKNSDIKILLSYKTIFELAINSYLDSNGRNKMYEIEIDLIIPDDRKLFINTIYKLNVTGNKILHLIKEYYENQGIFLSKEQLFEESLIAAYTNFDLKTDYKIDRNKILESNNPLVSDEFIRNLDFKNLDDIELLKNKLEEILNKNNKTSQSLGSAE
ncbi:MAG: hypothetical protein RLZZ175_781 [Bacteroidota bacterium]|jgi:hypothetical protein